MWSTESDYEIGSYDSFSDSAELAKNEYEKDISFELTALDIDLSQIQLYRSNWLETCKQAITTCYQINQDGWMPYYGWKFLSYVDNSNSLRFLHVLFFVMHTNQLK